MLVQVWLDTPLIWLLELFGLVWVLNAFVSDHPKAEAEARYMGQRLQSAIETLDDGFVIYDKDDRLIVCNERYREIYAASKEAIVPGNSFENILRYGLENGQYVAAIGREEEWLRERLTQHRHQAITIEQELDDGRWLRIAERETPNGEWVGFRVDISEQKAVQAELQEAKESAEAASEAKSRFLSQMNHELRSPLNGIVGFAQALNDPSQDMPEEDRQRYISNILEAARHLEMVIGDILDLSKIEQGKLVLDKVDFDLGALVHRAVDLFEDKAKDKGLQFELDLNTSALWLSGDQVRLRQVIYNLLDNAVKFTSHGRVVLRTEVVDVEHNPVHVRFAVEDTGIGIDAANKEAIFEPFNQADASINRRFGGTGLGLTISQQLVKAMGGELKVRSEEGKGSCFSFSLDLPLGRPKTLNTEEVNVPSMRVLVVDDITTNLTVARLLLEAEGHEVTLASSGEEALQLLTKYEFDLLLVDLHMPNMNGLELTQTVRQLDDETKAAVMIIILSADTQIEQKKAAKAAGVDAYLGKPLNIISLRNHILTLLARRALGR
jgi:signal transduction histidine kinase/CheY-like chemotaxis protein